ncbi:hypothetical protein JZ751_024710 [Albula glossodonta]|uniref:Uncharacterized protein n=1 Tax=Albula glossodonta TaxID=121402 RepID=A0A8T2PI45_9TELE|nr:hypothetical protein JZ751_024710 [Albula glossodonta]
MGRSPWGLPNPPTMLKPRPSEPFSSVMVLACGVLQGPVSAPTGTQTQHWCQSATEQNGGDSRGLLLLGDQSSFSLYLCF